MFAKEQVTKTVDEKKRKERREDSFSFATIKNAIERETPSRPRRSWHKKKWNVGERGSKVEAFIGLIVKPSLITGK